MHKVAIAKDNHARIYVIYLYCRYGDVKRMRNVGLCHVISPPCCGKAAALTGGSFLIRSNMPYNATTTNLQEIFMLDVAKGKLANRY